MSGPGQDAVEALEPIAQALEDLGIRYYVGGSLASSVRGAPRSSLDVDLSAELRDEHIRPFLDALEAAYYVSEERIRAAVAARRSFNAIHLATMMKVDIFVSRERPFDREAYARLTPEALDPAVARAYPIPRTEDVILLKLEWFRVGGEVSDRQWSDVLGMIRTAGPALDLSHLERWANELRVSDLLARALAQTSKP